MIKQYFECRCGFYDHVIRFTLDPDDGDVWVEVRMASFLPWWKRIWVAFQYVLGVRDFQRNHFAETLLKVEDYFALHDLLDRSRLIKKATCDARTAQEKSVLKG